MAETADRDANRALRARFDEVYGDYQRLRSGMDELQQRLAGLRVTARSADGLVAVTVGPRGQLVGLDLDRGVHRAMPPDELADLIVVVTASATAQVADEVRQLMTGYLPAGSGTLRFLRDDDLGSLLPPRDGSSLRDDPPRDDSSPRDGLSPRNGSSPRGGSSPRNGSSPWGGAAPWGGVGS